MAARRRSEPVDRGTISRDECVRRGTIPAQKWTNFYMKVLTRFASSPDLKIEVSFEVPVEADQGQTKADETRTGLKELGLDDDLSLT